MKILVCTASSQEYKRLSDVTSPSKKLYSNIYGYEFKEFTHKTLHRVGFERAEFWKEALPSCEWLFFTGCDAMITNIEVNLESFISHDYDFIFAVDGCGLQSDSWLMRNCKETRYFMDEVLNMEPNTPNEQDAMSLYLSGEKHLSNFLHSLPEPRRSDGPPPKDSTIDFLKQVLNKSPVRCKIVPQKSLNAYPSIHYGGNGKESWSWKPGDFVLHLPGKSLDYRIGAFLSYL